MAAAPGQVPEAGISRAPEISRGLWRQVGRAARAPVARSCLAAYIAGAAWIWNRLPSGARESAFGRKYGSHLHFVVRRVARRTQSIATLFMRNRAELDLLVRLLDGKAHGARVAICVIACSKGAEVWSILWAIRTVRPDLRLTVQAVDIAEEAVRFAEKGTYSLLGGTAALAPGTARHRQDGKACAVDTATDQTDPIFQRMDDDEIAAMFTIEDGFATVRPWLREGVTWRHGDARDPSLPDTLGPQDVVVANRFLCHMAPGPAAETLANVARLVRPGGWLFVSGIDHDVRSSVAKRMGWVPVAESIRQVHEGDPSLLRGWPTEYWGVEPFDTGRSDRTFRYASVYRIGSTGPHENPPAGASAKQHSLEAIRADQGGK